jgi:hypothetical protein
MKTIYTKMVNNEIQKSHPFGRTEKRFNWQNYSNGNDLKRHKKIVRMQDNLEGGIGRFLNRNRILNEREREKNNLKSHRNGSVERAHKYLNLDSQRVIYPEKDTEIQKVNKKRTYRSNEKDLLHTTDGRITTLLDKTPLHFNYRGKKMFNNSIDYGRKKDHNLFSNEFLNDMSYNRIPGVQRKHLNQNVNQESNPNDYYRGIKHYRRYRNKSQIY